MGLLCLATVTGGVSTAIGVQAGTVDAMGLLCLAAVTGGVCIARTLADPKLTAAVNDWV